MRLIEVFADVWCPFTHVGLRRLIARRAELGRADVGVCVRAWPLERVNGEPLTAEFVAEEIEALQASVAPDLFRGFDRSAFPATTLPALSLAAGAYQRDPRVGERVSLALRTALFEEGRDIADSEELIRIGAAAGLEVDSIARESAAVDDDLREGERRGVIGSPHFFIDGHGFFCPSLEIERMDGKLHVRYDEDGLAAFLDRCFAP